MKKLIKGFLRFFGLMRAADMLRFYYFKFRNRNSNRQFKNKFPDIQLPPDYMMYEAFQLDYSRYYFNGRKTAQWLIDLVKPFTSLKGNSILDWGCGPARVIRHLPDLIPEAASFTGTDYNIKTISWCKDHLHQIQFAKNDLMPPLPFEANSFDFVYGISIFTHLSAAAHEAWLNELSRVLKPQGLIVLTLHGKAFREKLGQAELEQFEANQLVVRGQVKEGHRTFIAFHPPEFVKKWAAGFEILNHIPGQPIGKAIEQDVWILRKSKND